MASVSEPTQSNQSLTQVASTDPIHFPNEADASKSDLDKVEIIDSSRVEVESLRVKSIFGSKQQLRRGYDLLSLVALGIVIANSWALTAGTIVTALPNGGPMAILYGLILVSFFYAMISASLAEMASAIPSAGGVYHFSSVLSKQYGKSFGLFTGYLNGCAWLLSAASVSSVLGNELVAMYILKNPDVAWRPWKVFIAYQACNWCCALIVCFANRYLPFIHRWALWTSLVGFVASILVLVIVPRGRHASNESVWVTYTNDTGGWSNGICFMIGLLNAAFAVGVPDCQSHLAEEVRDPQRTVPKGIMIQLLTAFVTAFIYLIALFYSISSLEEILTNPIPFFPTATIYMQATQSVNGTVGMIAILFIATFPTLIGTFVTGSRMWWALARADATPFSKFIAHVPDKQLAPVRAVAAMSLMVTILGCIYIGSTTAFQALISSFIVLSTLSYGGAILPHVLSRRRNIVPGPFHLGDRLGMFVNLTSLAYIAVTVVFFSFPFVLPVTARNMNYTIVIVAGLTAIVTIWWFLGVRKDYQGPKYSIKAAEHLKRAEREIEEANVAREVLAEIGEGRRGLFRLRRK